MLVSEFGCSLLEHAFDTSNTTTEDFQASCVTSLWGELATQSGCADKHCKSEPQLVSGQPAVGGSVMEYQDEWWKGQFSDKSASLQCPDYSASYHSKCGFELANGGEVFENGQFVIRPFYLAEEWFGLHAQSNWLGSFCISPRQLTLNLTDAWGGSGGIALGDSSCTFVLTGMPIIILTVILLLFVVMVGVLVVRLQSAGDNEYFLVNNNKQESRRGSEMLSLEKVAVFVDTNMQEEHKLALDSGGEVVRILASQHNIRQFSLHLSAQRDVLGALITREAALTAAYGEGRGDSSQRQSAEATAVENLHTAMIKGKARDTKDTAQTTVARRKAELLLWLTVRGMAELVYHCPQRLQLLFGTCINRAGSALEFNLQVT